MISLYCRNTPPSETLRYYHGLPLTGSPNRSISDFAIASSKFLASARNFGYAKNVRRNRGKGLNKRWKLLT